MLLRSVDLSLTSTLSEPLFFEKKRELRRKYKARSSMTANTCSHQITRSLGSVAINRFIVHGFCFISVVFFSEIKH